MAHFSSLQLLADVTDAAKRVSDGVSIVKSSGGLGYNGDGGGGRGSRKRGRAENSGDKEGTR